MNIEETITHLKNGKKMTICTLIRTFKKEGIENFVVTRKKYIETVLSELEKKEAIINEMAKEITEFLGTCPYDKYDWQDIDCEKVCEDDMKQCWVEYFEKKVEGK